MAVQVEDWFKEEWSAKVFHEYEDKGHRLKPMILPPDKITGSKLHYHVSGPGQAAPWEKGDKVRPMNAPRGMLEITATTIDATDYIYYSDPLQMTPSEKEKIQLNQAGALGRATDDVIFDAIHKKSGSYNTAIGSFSEAWTPQKAMNVRRWMAQKNVPIDGQIFCCMPSTAFQQMKAYPVVSSSDYTGPKLPLDTGLAAITWDGIHWVETPDRMFTRHAADGTSGAGLTFYAWHRFAIGCGSLHEVMSDMQWQLEYKRHVMSDWINIGALVLHDWDKDLGMKDGIVELRVDNASDIPLINATAA